MKIKISKAIVYLLIDLFIIYFTYNASFLIRFERLPTLHEYVLFNDTVIFPLLIYAVMFLSFGIYNRLWRYISLSDVWHILASIFCGTLIFLSLSPMLTGAYSFPRSIIIINTVILSLAVLMSRFMVRFIREEVASIFYGRRRRVLILGAGDAGALLLRDIKRTAADAYKVIGFLDDDRKKHGMSINGVNVISSIDNLPKIAARKRIEEVFIAIPSATQDQINRIISITKKGKIEPKMIPSTREILDSEKVFISQLKPIDLKDLLGRNPASIDSKIINDVIRNKRILVTGGGGSIGYEICRQVLNFGPLALMVLERDETRLFNIVRQLKNACPNDEKIVSAIADLNEQGRIEVVLSEFKPDMVFHAAAYKHVPLGEENPVSFVSNNIFGTVNLITACARIGVERFVFISSDKSVSPVTTMGATKRICEEYIRSFSGEGKASFITVRFGNVLGSSGSVIETFEEQIRGKSALTVTSEQVKRFFMTIEEAVTLSLEAAAIGKNADLYILDMGEPIRIRDLAENILALSKGADSKKSPILITGLRKGDKIEERLYEDSEVATKTGYDKLLQIQRKAEAVDHAEFLDWLKRLKDLIATDDPAIKEKLEKMFKEIMPTYTPYDEYLEKLRKKGGL